LQELYGSFVTLTNLTEEDWRRIEDQHLSPMHVSVHSTNPDLRVALVGNPKGAQIMLNNRVLDKTAPFDFYLNPGTYMVDITLSGYKPVHRVINVEQRDKVAIELALTPE
jgi:hypothetical protein